MNIKKNQLDQSLIEFIVELSTLEMAPFIKQATAELSKDIEVAGFRKGKAPANIVQQEIGEDKILQASAEKAINQKYPEIIAKEKLQPIDQPKIEIQKIAKDNPLIFKVIVAIIPSVKVGDYKKIKIKQEVKEIKKQDVDNVIKELQMAKKKEILVQRKANKGDKIEVDLNLFIDKVPVENGQVKNFSTILGGQEQIPGISKNLEGLKKGDKKEFSFKYPDSHYDKVLAGKLVDFKAEVKNVYEIELPKLDNDFAKGLGKFKTVEELKNKIKENVEAEQKNKQSQKAEKEILEQLVKMSEIDKIPTILVDKETDKMLEEIKMSIKNYNDFSNFEDYLKNIKKTEEQLKKELGQSAEQRVKTSLCIRQLAIDEKITISDKEVKAEIEKIQAMYKMQGQGEEQIQEMVNNLQTTNGQIYIKNLLTNRKIIEKLKEEIL
ncbi:trigger factor [Patescibacteria group bacterium]|nr:trigger factor [Patescibacteria group bacterium]